MRFSPSHLVLLLASTALGLPAAHADAPAPTAGSAKPAAVEAAPASVALAFEGTDPGTRDQAQKVEAELGEALARDGRLAQAKPAVQAAAAAPIDDGDLAAHLKAAKDAYDGLDLDTAAKEYGLAVRAAFEHPEHADVEKVAEIFLAMGAAYQLNADLPHAEAAYRFALALRPEIQADPQLFGPDLRKSIDAQRQSLQAAAATTLDVEVDGPSGAQVTVDGQDAGTSPVRGYKVLPGRHLVLAKAQGFTAAAQVVAATAGESNAAKLSLEETAEHKLMAGARARALGERTLAKPGPGISELAQKSGAKLVAVGALSSSPQGTTHLDLVLFDAQRGERVAGIARELEVEGSGFPAQMDALARELAQDVAHPPGDALAEAPGSGKPFYRRWYFWAGVGAAVVAGTAVAVATTQSSPHLSHGAGLALGL